MNKNGAEGMEPRVAPDAGSIPVGSTLPTCIEICASAGGMALGFERAGFEHLALVEIEELRCQVLRKNRPAWPVFCANMKTWEWSGPRPDLLAGGVPCQPASRAGKRKLNADPRDLWADLPALIERIRPRGVCFENVPGCADNPNVRALSDWLNARGWGWTWWKCNAADFGVPQTRERWFFVALKGAGILMEVGPAPTVEKWMSVEEALKGDYGVASTLPNWLMNKIGQCDQYVSGQNANGHGRQYRPLDEPAFCLTKGASKGRARRNRVVIQSGQRRTDEPAFTVPASRNGADRRIIEIHTSGELFNGGSRDEGRPLAGPAQTIAGERTPKKIVVGTQYTSAKSDGDSPRGTDEPAKTVTGKHQLPRIVMGAGNQTHRIVDGIEVWALTERQLQRLQAFPDDWMGMTTAMIGDAVPPPMAEAVGRRLIEILSRNTRVASEGK